MRTLLTLGVKPLPFMFSIEGLAGNKRHFLHFWAGFLQVQHIAMKLKNANNHLTAARQDFPSFLFLIMA